MNSVKELNIKSSLLIQDYSGLYIFTDKPDIYLMLDSIPITTKLEPGEKYISSHLISVFPDFFFTKIKIEL